MNQLSKNLREIISAQLPKEYTSVSYAIMQHGELLAADALGHRGDTAKTPADLSCTYNVASISKVICAIAVMQLVEQDKVRLDTPLTQYLPRLYMPDSRYSNITLRHCLNHSSGLPGTQWQGFSVTDLQQEGSGYYDDVYAYLAKSYLKADPGAYAVYCNDGFTLAEMVIAEVAGMSYGQYCLQHITMPMGAESARLFGMHSPTHPLVQEAGRPKEQLLIQGGAGFTMTMVDLCRLGQLFLAPNTVISETSKAIMSSPQGKTFLQGDSKTASYGLGWDSVSFIESDYRLGEGVLAKSGNSFQFTTMFYVIPAYDAVLAISNTHDCQLDIAKLILRLFATAMLDQGVNLYAHSLPMPPGLIEDYKGVYLTQNCVYQLLLAGACADLVWKRTDGEQECLYKDLRWDGTAWISETGQRFFIEEKGGKRYLLSRMKGPSFPFAMQAQPLPLRPAAWQQRVGRQYVICHVRPGDIVVRDILSGFRIQELAGYSGIYILSFSCRPDSGVYRCFDGCVAALDDSRGASLNDTPSNPGRDFLHPRFYVEDGVEYCDVASYLYREVGSLPTYSGEEFPSIGRTAVYRFTAELKALPSITPGRRIMVLSKEMITKYDSLFETEYTPVKDGYLLLI